jgi:molecular chaperone GrpE
MRRRNLRANARVVPVTDSESAPEEAPDETAEGAPALPEGSVADLDTLLAETEDRWKRAAADLENYRKRFQRELERLRRAERETLLLAWLDVVDNMERALGAEGAASNPWFEGMEAIYQQMLSMLKRFGAEPFEAMGQTFDPERHEAVATANAPDQPEGLVVDVTQVGYEMDSKLLRPAKVVPVKHT